MDKEELLICVQDEESRQKEIFVRDYLAPLLKALGIGIVDAEYHKYLGHGEHVIITYQTGYTKEKDVSADSLQAMVIDVFKDGL